MPRVLIAECACGEERTFESASSQALAVVWALRHQERGVEGCDHVVNLVYRGGTLGGLPIGAGNPDRES